MRISPRLVATAVAASLTLFTAAVTTACGSTATSTGAATSSTRSTVSTSATGEATSATAAENSATADTAESSSSMSSTSDSTGTTDATEATGTAGSPTPQGGSPTKVPTKIISLSATATEMLYAIEAQDQVIAVDNLSNYPPEAADKMVGLDAWQPSVEAITALEPDLVITDGTNPDFLASLDEVGIAHWEGMAATNFDDIYTQIEQLGAATGHVGPAAEVVAQMQTDIAAILAAAPAPEAPLSIYHELDDTYYSATSDTFIGFVYSQLGLTNIADAAGGDTPYPQLNAEYIVESNPDIIFLADTSFVPIDSVPARPGWDAISAVANNNIFAVDEDLSSRWGPRVVEFLQTTSDQVAQAISVTAGG